jgi:hypothetical protein
MRFALSPRMTTSQQGTETPAIGTGAQRGAPGQTDLERAAGFGQWWYDPLTGQSLLSAAARDYLEMPGDTADHLDACFGHVFEEDLPELIRLWTGAQNQRPLDIRVIGLAHGMRWLRVTPLPPDPARPRCCRT